MSEQTVFASVKLATLHATEELPIEYITKHHK